MINYHPTDEMLTAFAVAELPTTLSLAVSMHVEMCSECKRKVEQITAQQADQTFESAVDLTEEDFSFMLDEITADDSLAEIKAIERKTVDVKGETYQLPRALTQLELGSWFNVGNLSRARVELEEGDLRCNLLHFDKGGEVPMHTHKGFEVTLLLDGSFKDDMGRYEKGDFILLDGSHEHQPHTDEGCLCFTVADDALHFTQGISQILNPIGKLIY